MNSRGQLTRNIWVALDRVESHPAIPQRTASLTSHTMLTRPLREM